ncbi:YcxB family protein [Haloferula sp. BvORR071]|uniref:YcxB family protein n=1 Tax=Haloferula sp. BvORR071 TaxID=1396141 RepID=UPI00054E0108|nr:YcxB family protein [Haloferula sp. BvORR071]
MTSEIGSAQDLEAEVNITRRDLCYLNWYLVVRNKVIWITGIILSFALVWNALAGRNPNHDVVKTVITILIGGILLISFVMVTAGFSVLAAMLRAGRSAGVLGRHIFRISEEGLRETTDVNDSLMNWKGLFAIKDIGSYLLVYQTPAMVHVLPRRCFADGGDYMIFEAALRERLRIARGESR